MEMCYDGTLVMPSSYAVMSEDEMTYVEGGGWTTYKGNDALLQLSVMAGQVYGCAVAAGKLGKALAAGALTCETGWGLVVAVAASLGLSVCIVAGTAQAVFFFFFLLYHRQYKAFDAYSVSIWQWSATLGIRKATS